MSITKEEAATFQKVDANGKAEIKTYVLNESMEADAPIYQTTPHGREKIKKIPFHRPTLRQTFQDENGISRTIRYISSSSYIDQQAQMEIEKIEANRPFTVERNEYFRHGQLTTNKKILQMYLEAHPECEGFKGTCDEVRATRYRILNPEVDAAVSNKLTRLAWEAAGVVLKLEKENDVKGLQELIIRLNGSFVEGLSDKVPVLVKRLMDFIDANEEEGLKAVVKNAENLTVDEKVTVLIGSLLQKELLKFDDDAIKKKDKGGNWINVRELTNEYSLEERKRLFSDFLNTEEGKALKTDLEKDLKASEKKKE